MKPIFGYLVKKPVCFSRERFLKETAQMTASTLVPAGLRLYNCGKWCGEVVGKFYLSGQAA